MHNFVFAIEGGLQVLITGLLLGAGLPMVFAFGVRAMAYGTNANGDGRPHAIGKVLAVFCFSMVVVAVALGITFIVASGFGLEVSFENVYPTLVRG